MAKCLWLGILLGMTCAGCGSDAPLPSYDSSPPPREWATEFRVEESYCDGEDMGHRLLPCVGDIEALSVVQQGVDRVCLRLKRSSNRLPWVCLDHALSLPSSDEVSLNRSDDGFTYLRQSPLLRPGPATRVRLTFRRLPDDRWLLIEDAQEGRFESSARRQILYLILAK